jgi:hypothetical protein
VKFKLEKFMKKLQVDFIKIKSIILNMNFSLACKHHKLNFEVYWSKIWYFMTRLATLLYVSIPLVWSNLISNN